MASCGPWLRRAPREHGEDGRGGGPESRGREQRQLPEPRVAVGGDEVRRAGVLAELPFLSVPPPM